MVAHTYEALHAMTVAQLRDVATSIDDERLQGHTQLHKEQLLPLLCEVLGIEAHVHHEVVGIDKSAIKAEIRDWKTKRDEALAAGDRVGARRARRKIHRLKRTIRRATV